MTHRSDMIWFDINDDEVAIKDKILQEPHSVYPICDGQIDNIKGVESIKDLYVAEGLANFKDLMQPPLYVPENNTAYRIWRNTSNRRSIRASSSTNMAACWA